MADNDYSVQATSSMPSVNQKLAKPAHLIILDASGKTKQLFFLANDKPDLHPSHVQARGIFISNLTQEEVVNTYNDLLTNANKEDILEVYFPWHRVQHIRSLVFKAK